MEVPHLHAIYSKYNIGGKFMKTHGKIIFFTIVFLVFLFPVLAKMDVQVHEENINELQNLDKEARKKAFDIILIKRHKIVEECIMVSQEYIEKILSIEGAMTDKESQTLQNYMKINRLRERANELIQLIGTLRAKEAVPFLCANISYDGSDIINASYKDITYYHPCAGALIEIGMPSLEPVLENACSTDDEKVSYLSAIVVKRVLGKELALNYMDSAIALEKSEEHKKRLISIKSRIEATTNERFSGH